MVDHGWVLDPENLVGDSDFDAEGILEEYAPDVGNSVPMIGEEVLVTTTNEEEGASGEEATRGGEMSQEATRGETAVEEGGAESDWWKIKDPNTLVVELGASDVPGVQEGEDEDVLSVIAVRKS